MNKIYMFGIVSVLFFKVFHLLYLKECVASPEHINLFMEPSSGCKELTVPDAGFLEYGI